MTKPTQNWRALYVAALNEPDCQKLAERIAEAQKALIRRARELFLLPDDNFEEEQAIDAALNRLSVLHRCLRPSRKKTA